MERLGGHTWKQFYSEERIRSQQIIDNHILKWMDRKDEKVEEIIAKGGALSFPHTYLASSIEAHARTASAMIKLKKSEVNAFGVFHRISGSIENEFSLDNFRYVLERAAFLSDVEIPLVNTIFLPMRPYDENEPHRTIQDLTDEVEHLKKKDISDTALVLTGDLYHYGRIYGTKDFFEDPDRMILDSISHGLDLIYIKNDPIGYIVKARSDLNDQWAIAVALRSILPDELEWDLITYELADYSRVLDSEPPCLVASTFYGVYPRN